jgi:hypothetical protein
MKSTFMIVLAMLASLSAFAGNVNVKIVVDTQNIRLSNAPNIRTSCCLDGPQRIVQRSQQLAAFYFGKFG